jgi:hypothetical protein
MNKAVPSDYNPEPTLPSPAPSGLGLGMMDKFGSGIRDRINEAQGVPSRGMLRRQSTRDSRLFKMTPEDMANMAALGGGGGLKEAEIIELIDKHVTKDREKIQSIDKLVEVTVMEMH